MAPPFCFYDDLNPLFNPDYTGIEMDKSSLKITELPALSIISENGFIPIAQSKETDETYKVTLQSLRETVLFENAFASISSGIAATVLGDTFFVYTDTTKEHVLGWVNTGAGATPLLNSEGEQVTYGTYVLLNNALKDKGTIVQWVYNGGLSNGGEQTFTVPLSAETSVQEVYVDGLRQFKGVGFKLADDNPLTFTLASALSSGQTVVAICFSNEDIEQVNEAFLATYTGPTGASNIGVIGGGTVQSELEARLTNSDLTKIMGVWVGATVEIKELTVNHSKIISRGFYEEGDGGNGIWVVTGAIDAEKSGKHVINEGKIYNKNGVEYLIDISSGKINAAANGAKSFLASEQLTALVSDTDDIVCIGQVINGITHQLGDSFPTSKNSYKDTVNSPLFITVSGGYYRIGNEAIKVKSHISYEFGKALFKVIPTPSFKINNPGKLLNGVEHSIDDILAVYDVVQGEEWGALTASNWSITGGQFQGDHNASVSESNCGSGYGLYLINVEYARITDTIINGFIWPIMARQINSMSNGSGGHLFDTDRIGKVGNFYGLIFTNVRCNAGRRGLAYIDIDWCSWNGGSLCDSQDWINGADKKAPDHFLVDRGAGFLITNCNLSVQHSDLSNLRFQPAKSVVLTKAKGSSYISNYLEWTQNFMLVAKEGWNSGGHMTGLVIDNIAAQYRPNATWKLLSFENGCFGSFQNDIWEDPVIYSSQGARRGITFLRIGAPLRDVSAFKHGGYDFKYGTYGLTYSGSVPDIDFCRDNRKYKDFLSPYGLVLNSGNLRFPLRSPKLKSNICIWFKDLTGTYNVNNMRIWINGGEGADKGLWAGRGIECIDFGNGYKMATIQNLRENVNDGTNADQAGVTLQISTTPSSPIVIKAIEAYTGGVPLFPAGCEYVPESSGELLWDSSNWLGAVDSTRMEYGGGYFKAGDVVNPTVGVTANSYDDYGYIVRTPTISTNGYNGNRVITGGLTLGNAVNHAFTALITEVSSDRTIITVSASNSIYIFAGMPHWVSATTGEGTIGQTFVIDRIANADGTLSYQYVLSGIRGVVGDTLTLDGTLIPPYTSTSGNPSFDTRVDVGQAVRIGYNNTAAGTREVQFYTGGNQTISGRIQWTNDGSTNIYGQNKIVVQSDFSASNIIARATSTYNLGSTTTAWRDIYSQNAVTVVSDRRYKDFIEEISDEVLDVWGTVGFSQWKLKTAIEAKGTDEARVHFGIVAQDIKEAFELAGLDATKNGILIYDSWDAQEEILDEAGSVVQEAREAGDIWMVRMEECLALEAAYVRREMEKQRQQLQSLMDALGHS